MLVAACEKQKVVDLGFIHRFVPSSDKNPRTFLLLHGTGGNESDLLPLGRALDPKAALLSPRGKILENGAPRFFRRFAEGVFDEEDVVRRANELADFVLVAADEYKIDRADLTAVGYSNGANIAASLLLAAGSFAVRDFVSRHGRAFESTKGQSAREAHSPLQRRVRSDYSERKRRAARAHFSRSRSKRVG